MNEYIFPPRLRIVVAAIVSIALHVALILLAPKPPDHPTQMASMPGPLTVTIEQPKSSPPPAAAAASAPPPPQRPAPRQMPRPLITARPHTPSPEMVPPPEPPQPAPAPPPVPTPSVDMLAMINARRAQRRAAEAQAERESEGVPGANLNGRQKGLSAIQRNLDTLKDDDRTGGIFQILSQDSYTAEYVFNGWRPDTHRRWRQLIEVRAKPGEDIELAIVRSMIELIRGHYQGDFQWESHRLGKVVTLSARLADNRELEEFLVREFYGVPVLKRPEEP
jgi:hypothetical protein